MLTRSLAGWQSQYERMQRSFERLKREYRSSIEYDDDLLHFFMDCWHLKDWIKNDTRLPKTLQDAIESEVKSHLSLEVAADLANGWKHLSIDEKRYPPRVGANVTAKSVGWDFGTGKVDVRHEVTMSDGSVVSAQAVADDACNAWRAILAKLGLVIA